jgi:hypothetical protein
MKTEVAEAIEELKRQFPDASVTSREDGAGGAVVIMEPITLGVKYRPASTWVGFHLSAQYPYADIYPVFIGSDVARADGVAFEAPVTSGHTFEGRPAIQVSRRNTAAQNGAQRAPSKVLKILDYMERLAP